MSKLYSPPPGYYDLPFTWCYDASKLTNGVRYPNQYVYLQGGYGDFILRRIVGLSRILNPTTGQYQIQDNSGKYISAFPIFGVNADDIGLAPELRYQETGAIKFDLGIMDLPGVPTTGQIAFQGVRRMKGTPVRNPNYQSTPKTYTYILNATVPAQVGNFNRYWVPITNYDFELYQTIILAGASGAGTPFCYIAEAGGVSFQNLTAGNVTLNIALGPPSITVSGSIITVSFGTQGGATITAFLNLWNATPAAGALASATLAGATCGTTTGSPGTTPFYANNVVGQILLPTTSGAANLAALTSPFAKIWLYDQNKVAVSSAPVLDLFMDGGPNGVYKNGAHVTPIWYAKDTQIQVDVYSETAGGAALTIYFVGRQYLPCA